MPLKALAGNAAVDDTYNAAVGSRYRSPYTKPRNLKMTNEPNQPFAEPLRYFFYDTQKTEITDGQKLKTGLLESTGFALGDVTDDPNDCYVADYTDLKGCLLTPRVPGRKIGVVSPQIGSGQLWDVPESPWNQSGKKLAIWFPYETKPKFADLQRKTKIVEAYVFKVAGFGDEMRMPIARAATPGGEDHLPKVFLPGIETDDPETMPQAEYMELWEMARTIFDSFTGEPLTEAARYRLAAIATSLLYRIGNFETLFLFDALKIGLFTTETINLILSSLIDSQNLPSDPDQTPEQATEAFQKKTDSDS